MGEKKRRLQKFKLRQPNCIFCAQTRKTETIEHAPPKAFFRNKYRLKGLEFPACQRCNTGSSQLDQVASMMALGVGNIEQDEYWKKLLIGIKNNTPEVLSYLGVENAEYTFWINSANKIDEIFKVPIDYRLFEEFLNPWAAKIGFAFWHEHTDRILTQESLVWVRWITNYQLLNQ